MFTGLALLSKFADLLKLTLDRRNIIVVVSHCAGPRTAASGGERGARSKKAVAVVVVAFTMFRTMSRAPWPLFEDSSQATGSVASDDSGKDLTDLDLGGPRPYEP